MWPAADKVGPAAAVAAAAAEYEAEYEAAHPAPPRREPEPTTEPGPRTPGGMKWDGDRPQFEDPDLAAYLRKMAARWAARRPDDDDED